MQLFEYRSVRYGSKEINGTLTGAQKNIFLIRGRQAAQGEGGHTGVQDRVLARESRVPGRDRGH